MTCLSPLLQVATRVSTNRERPLARAATATRARRGAMLRRLRDVALSVPVVITINDCVGSVAPANLAHLPVAPADAGDRAGSSPGTEVPSSSGRADPERALVVLDRVAPRAFTFARGDVVYLRDPSDPTAWRVRRLVAMEGDWVTAPRSDDVRKVPKGHCWLERAGVRPGDDARRTPITKSNTAEGDERGEEEGGMMVPVALLDARVPFVLWPPRGFGPVRRDTPPGRVLMHHSPA